MHSLRTIRKNNWKTRNDSTSVAQILHPHQFENEHCRRHSSPPINRKTKTCYCQRSPVRSKFINFKPNDSPKTNYGVETINRRRSADCVKECHEKAVSASYRIEEPENVCAKNLLLQTSKCKEISDCFQNKEIEKNLKDLNTFRKENYFDCHSTQNLNDKLDNHKCLHKFVLNDRLMPQPLNPDPFGTSRCIHCYRPMDVELSTPPEKKGNYQTTVLKNLKSPPIKSITVTKKKGVTEIEIPSNLHKFVELLDNSGNLKVAQPSNSIALRHQKGVYLD